MSNSVTPWSEAHQSSWSFTISQSLLRLVSIESVMLSNHLFFCCPCLLLPSIFPHIRVFIQWVSSSYQVVKVLKLQHWSIQLIFKVDFLYDWLFLSPYCPRDSQESSRTTVWKHQFFIAQSSLWSNFHIRSWLMKIALTLWTFVTKLMPLLFNMLPQFVIAFLPRGKLANWWYINW